MGLGLIVVIIFGIIFAQGMIAGTDSNSNEEKLNQGSQGIDDLPDTIKSTPKTYMKPLNDLLPTIDDLGINWRLDENDVDTNKKLLEMVIPEDDVDTYQIQSIGLVESASEQYTKLETPSTWKYWVTVSLYKFNTTNEALQQWNNIKDYQDGNKAFDVYEEKENCRSIQESRTFRDRHTDLCYTNNILILIEYTTDVGISYYKDFPLLSIINKNIEK